LLPTDALDLAMRPPRLRSWSVSWRPNPLLAPVMNHVRFSTANAPLL